MTRLNRQEYHELVQLTRAIDVVGVFTPKELLRERRLSRKASEAQRRDATDDAQINRCSGRCCAKDRKPFYY